MVAALIDTLYLAGKEEKCFLIPLRMYCAKKPYLDSGCAVPQWSTPGEKSVLIQQ